MDTAIPEHEPQIPAILFDDLVNAAAYLYLCRVPILIGLVLFFLPFTALSHLSPVLPLLQTLFMLTLWGTFWSTVSALLVCWSLLLTGLLPRLNGVERFGMPQQLSVENLHASIVFLAMVPAIPLVAGQFLERSAFQYGPVDLLWRALMVAFGLLTAYLVAYASLFAAILLAPAGTQKAADIFPAFEFMRGWLRWADRHSLFPGWLPRLGLRLRDRLPQGLWSGYINSDTGHPWGGHWLAFMFFLATFVLYILFDIYRRAHLGETAPFPALMYVLLLLLNANWVFSFLAFFFDRYRIPLIVPIALFCFLGAHSPSSDHYYTLQRGAMIDPIHPKDVLLARSAASGLKPIVVIATAGGGIQAASWTAQVLAGLEEQSKAWKASDSNIPSFAESVALISSVSGGATGSMFYLNLYHPDRTEHFDVNGLKHLPDMASDSSLEDVAWALVYRDIPRIFALSWNRSSEEKLIDRGYMLEESWRNRANIQANLSNWRSGVAEGLRPAAIFNATIAETGEPLMLSTTDMNANADNIRRRSFYELYPNSDLPVVTAVRLAATFPYVTPAARALSTKPEYHVVDGGYYDNYGISSALAWLGEGFAGLQKCGKPLPDVLFIQIRSFPDDALNAPTNKGWFFQTYAPLRGLLSVRTTAQLIRDREELELFAQRWAKSSGTTSLSSHIHFASFVFKGHEAPLSWSMTPKQRSDVTEDWDGHVGAGSKDPDLLEVHCFFEPSHPDCSLLPKKGPW